MVLLPIADVTPKGVLQVPLDAALTWVSHALGASKPLPTPDRTFTPIEQALVRKIVEDALDDLRYSFGGLLAHDVTAGGFQFNSQFAQAAQKGDLMIVASFTIRVGDRVAPGTLALPPTPSSRSSARPPPRCRPPTPGSWWTRSSPASRSA